MWRSNSVGRVYSKGPDLTSLDVDVTESEPPKAWIGRKGLVGVGGGVGRSSYEVDGGDVGRTDVLGVVTMLEVQDEEEPDIFLGRTETVRDEIFGNLGIAEISAKLLSRNTTTWGDDKNNSS